MKSVTVRKMPGHSYAMEIENGRHVLTLDEMPVDGGEDLGPTPYEFLLSAVGGCTAITVLLYAQRKGWAIEDVTVTLTQDKVKPGESDAFTPEEAAMAGPNGRLDLIQIKLFVKGDLDDEQLERLLQIANRCPVHKTLETPAKITSELIRVD